MGPEAARLSPVGSGRWPEVSSPAQRLGTLLAFLGTTASMIAVINSAMAGIGVTLHLGALVDSPVWATVAAGIATTFALAALFHQYQR